MKKLMIAAAVAAMIGATEAATDYVAQVYNFTGSLKTTVCKETKVSKALENYFDGNGDSLFADGYVKGDKIGLRQQASRKLLGIIWGCNCPTIQCPSWRVFNNSTLGGYMFWDQSINDYLRVTRTHFGWKLLNRIGAMDKAEGVFSLYNDVKDQAIAIRGAGFGSVCKQNCSTYLKSMSGNIAGVRQPNDGDYSKCVFCQAGNGCVVQALCDTCMHNAHDAEDGISCYGNAGLTVVSGTFTIKYNSSLSKKLASRGRLSQVYTFKKAGDAQSVLALLELNIPGNPVKDDDDEDCTNCDMTEDEVETISVEDLETAVKELDEEDEDGITNPIEYVDDEDIVEDFADFS